MLFTWLAFFFVAFGAKLLLALAMIYLIFPAERACMECDGETLPLRMGWAGRATSYLVLGSLQRRWCPRCGWEGMTRTGRLNRPGKRTHDARTQPAIPSRE